MTNQSESQLEKVVADLADPYEWSWTKALSQRDAADAVLGLLNRHGLIDYKKHPSGGYIWRCNGKLFGRTDGIVDFDSLVDSK